MRIDRRSFRAAVAVFGLLASLAWENQAAAQVTETLYLGGPYNSFSYTLNGVADSGSGPIANSTLGGVPLAAVYCIDIPDTVNVPGTYTNNNVNTNGQAVYGNATWGGQASPNTWANGTNLASVPNAGQIAYLMDHYAAGATTTVQQEALQAAIWTEVYGSKFQVSNSTGSQAAIYNQMLVYLTGVGSDPVSNVLWLSPGGIGRSPIEQALVAMYATPEPSTFAIAGLGALAFIGYGLRRRKALGA